MRFTFLALLLSSVSAATALYHSPNHASEFTSNRTRLLLYFRRNQSFTFDEFSDYWRGPHAQLYINTATVKQNLLKYEQVGTFLFTALPPSF